MDEPGLLVKWFVGYGVFQSPPDHTTLQRFEIWVLTHQPRLFFDEILRQIDALCPEDRRRMQLVDTYAMLARGAKSSIIGLIRGASSKLLKELEVCDPQRFATLVAQLDLVALFGQDDDKPTAFLTAQERDERLQQVARQALRLHHLLSELLDTPPFLSPDDQAPLRLWLGHLHKIIHDEASVKPNPADEPDAVTVRERPHGKKGSYRQTLSLQRPRWPRFPLHRQHVSRLSPCLSVSQPDRQAQLAPHGLHQPLP